VLKKKIDKRVLRDIFNDFSIVFLFISFYLFFPTD
jgi:hypothetical protein